MRSEAQLASDQGNHRLQEGRPGMLWKGLAVVGSWRWLHVWQCPEGSVITSPIQVQVGYYALPVQTELPIET